MIYINSSLVKGNDLMLLNLHWLRECPHVTKPSSGKGNDLMLLNLHQLTEMTSYYKTYIG